MLIRFTGIDLLRAAGASGKVPSRLGAEPEAVIKETHPNGTSLQPAVIGSDSPELLSGDLLLDADGEEVLNKDREEFYGPRRTAVLVLLLLVAVAILVFVIRHISNRRRRSKIRLTPANPRFSKDGNPVRTRSKDPDEGMYNLVERQERD